MEIRVGDTVRFLSEKLEGVVSGIVNASTVNVYCEVHGFDIPAAVDDLVVIRPGSKRLEGTAKDDGAPLTRHLYLAFVPDKFEALAESRHELCLVNDTPHAVLFTVSRHGERGDAGLAAGSCNSGGVVAIGNYSLEELDALHALHVQALFHEQETHAPFPAIDVTVKVRGANLCKGSAYRQAPRIGRVALLRVLDEAEVVPVLLQQAPREKQENKTPPPPVPSPVPGNTLEVDLHADSLLDTLAGMEGRDILEHQLDVFRETMEKYKLRRGFKIVFIHGKGDGVLRQRLRWELQTKYKRCLHQDASFKQYGYGATLVTIK
jgi:hypothetical protein